VKQSSATAARQVDRALYREFYNAPDPQRWGRTEMPEQFGVTKGWLEKLFRGDAKLRLLELGCGLGAMAGLHPRYLGCDFSHHALATGGLHGRAVNADMQRLPFADAAFDFVFSWAALEHVPQPELVLGECARVLRSQGVLLLAPAWNVRSWAADALPVRPYAELGLRDRLLKASIPLRNHIAWRSAAAAPRRFLREWRMLCGQQTPFDYRRLAPRFDAYTYTDCDAFTAMDAHAALVYFASRGWRLLSHPTGLARLFCRHDVVVVQKP